MGQSLCKDQVATRPTQSGLILWGDYINSDTRTVIAILEICSEKYTFKCMDTLTNKHLDEPDFLKANPTLDIPVIVESHFSIISGPMQYVNYLIQTRDSIRKTLYPSESKSEIDRNIQHFTGKVRPITGKLIRMLTSRLQEDFKNPAKMTQVSKEVQERMSLSSSRPSLQVPD